MYLRFDSVDFSGNAVVERVIRAGRAEWSVIIPFYNERGFIGRTIAALAQQDVSFELILVDNGSTDGSAEEARRAAESHHLPYRLIVERRPGKVSALAAGLAAVRTPFVATCDADTWYPSHYLRAAGGLLRRPGCVAAGAYFVAPGQSDAGKRRAARHVKRSNLLFAGQCHTGGAGQAFRTDALRRAGGFDPQRWNLVLEDHEIIHQVLKHGRMKFSRALWCMPSPRERNRASTKWTRLEQLVYHLAVGRTGDWFFRHFLGPRLSRRFLTSDRLREVPQSTAMAYEPAYSVR